MSPADWRHDVNPRGNICQVNQRGICTIAASANAAQYRCSVFCGLLVTKQWPATANLTIENTLGDSVDAGNHPAGHCVLTVTRYRLTTLTFSVVEHLLCHQQRCAEPSGNESSARTLVTNSYIEGDVDIVSGRAQWCSITPNSAW